MGSIINRYLYPDNVAGIPAMYQRDTKYMVSNPTKSDIEMVSKRNPFKTFPGKGFSRFWMWFTNPFLI
jgi:hypothetical protein